MNKHSSNGLNAAEALVDAYFDDSKKYGYPLPQTDVEIGELAKKIAQAVNLIYPEYKKYIYDGTRIVNHIKKMIHDRLNTQP